MSEGTTAKIRGKGLEHTGVTEAHAADMYQHVGAHYVGVVDLKVAKHSVDADGNRSVELIIEGIELAPLDDRSGTAEHLRKMTRALHYERGLAVNGGGQLPIEGTDEPTVEQVRAAGRAHEPDPEADERDLEAQEAADTDPVMDAVNDAADADMAALQAEESGDPWDEGPPVLTDAAKVASPFDIPDPDPEPAPAA